MPYLAFFEHMDTREIIRRPKVKAALLYIFTTLTDRFPLFVKAVWQSGESTIQP